MFGKRNEVRQWVEDLLQGKPTSVLLKLYPKLAAPFLLDALDDPRALQGREPPIGAICELLEPLHPPKAAPYVIGVLPTLTREARWHATALLVAIGTPACHDAVAANLKSGDDASDKRNFNFVWHGLKDWAKPRSGTGKLFDAIYADLNEGNPDSPDHHISMLLRLDPDRAATTFTAPAWLGVASRYAHSILWGFHETRTRMPGDVLFPLLPDLRHYESDLSAPGHDAYGVGLMVLARSAPGLARPLVEAELQNPASDAHWGACEAMAIMHGVEDAHQVAYCRLDRLKSRGGFNRLPEENQNYEVAYQVDAQVCNGGWSQFFTNPSGSIAHLAPGALTAIGAPHAAELARKALATLHEAGGLEPGETLFDRLGAMPTVEQLGHLDDAYYERKDRGILSLLKLYAAKHPQHFR